MDIDWATKTDTGRIRTQNEDAVRAEPETGLAVLCDGMGGHRAGEVASRMAVESFFQAARSTDPPQPCLEAPGAPESVSSMIQATWAANEAIFARAEDEEACRGMGCTLVALHLRDDTASFVSVGDSRLYLHRAGSLHRISQDHTRLRMLEKMGINLDPTEAKQIQGMLVRALGTQRAVDIDFGHGATVTGDVWLLCSDGLTDELNDEEIETILGHSSDAATAVEECVRRALDAGGRDNVTVAIARIVSGLDRTGAEEIPRPFTCSPDGGGDSEPEGERGLLSRISRRIRGGAESGKQDGTS